MQKNIAIGVSLDRDILEKIDQERRTAKGDVPRSVVIRRLLKKALDSEG